MYCIFDQQIIVYESRNCTNIYFAFSTLGISFMLWCHMRGRKKLFAQCGLFAVTFNHYSLLKLNCFEIGVNLKKCWRTNTAESKITFVIFLEHLFLPNNLTTSLIRSAPKVCTSRHVFIFKVGASMNDKVIACLMGKHYIWMVFFWKQIKMRKNEKNFNLSIFIAIWKIRIHCTCCAYNSDGIKQLLTVKMQYVLLQLIP